MLKKTAIVLASLAIVALLVAILIPGALVGG